MFVNLKINKVCGQVIESNGASLKLHAKLGFQQEGYLRDHISNKGNIISMIQFGLLLDDWVNIGFIKKGKIRNNQTIYKEVDFILASCKMSHYVFLDNLTLNTSSRWSFASNQTELEKQIDFSTPKKIFFLHWNWKVPKNITDSIECICFHMTDVPYGRGGSPLQNLILRGHTSTKLSALKMEESLDTGPVYLKKELSLEGSARQIFRRVYHAALPMIVDIVLNNFKLFPQKSSNEEIFIRRKPYESEISKDTCESEELYDYIRMLDDNTYPNAFISFATFKIKFTNAVKNGNEITAIANITKLDKS